MPSLKTDGILHSLWVALSYIYELVYDRLPKTVDTAVHSSNVAVTIEIGYCYSRGIPSRVTHKTLRAAAFASDFRCPLVVLVHPPTHHTNSDLPLLLAVVQRLQLDLADPGQPAMVQGTQPMTAKGCLDYPETPVPHCWWGLNPDR